MIIALNTWAVPVLTYSFGIIKWTDTDLEGCYRLTSGLPAKCCCLHPTSSI